jgi:glycolate oxidase iron-sulfur subunit
LLSGLVTIAAAFNASIINRLPAESGLRLTLSLLDGKLRQQQATSGPCPAHTAEVPRARNNAFYSEESDRPRQASYFIGCLATHLYPQIGVATETLLKKAYGWSPGSPPEQTCCGLAAYAAGNLDEARKLAKKNIAAFEHNSLPILTTCASCYAHLSAYPDVLTDDPDWHERASIFARRVCEFSTFLNKAPVFSSGSRELFSHPTTQQRIVYHDPCHLRFGAGITAAPRRLLTAAPGIDLLELPHGPQCCGQGGLFNIAHPDLSRKIRDTLIEDFDQLEADTVVTSCSGCLLQWQMGLAARKSRSDVKHIAILLAEHLNLN